MKKIFLTGATVLMALIIAAPSFAIENKVHGEFTLNGVLNLNADTEKDKTQSYREMQLRIHTETQVTDKISFYTRFDILDKVLSSQFSNTGEVEEDDNIQFDHAWMQIISPVGLFRIGRKEGVKWGTDFFDDGDDYGTDRAEWILPLDVGDNKFYLVGVAEKALETKEKNRDNDKFYVTGTYVTDTYKTGLLLGVYKYNSYQQEVGADELTDAYNNMGDSRDAYFAAATGGADPHLVNHLKSIYDADTDTFGTAAEDYRPRGGGAVAYISPYFSGKLGPFTINAEYDYIDGELDFHDIKTTEMMTALAGKFGYDVTLPPTDPGNAAAIQMADSFLNQAYANTKDVNMSAYWVEGAYEAGPANIELGYAFFSGDEDASLNDLEAAALLGQGEDWEKVFILTGDDHGMDASLGGDGNLLEIGSDMSYAGLKMMYAGASYSVTENLKLGGIVAYATADEKLKKTDETTGATYYLEDDYGTEIDLTLSWKFMGNLTYNGTIAHLLAGDFWKKGAENKDVKDVTALYHELVLNF